MTNGRDTRDNENRPSCEKTLSRKEFCDLVLKRAALAGAIVSIPAIADKFLVPPALASSSTCNGTDTGGAGGGDTTFPDVKSGGGQTFTGFETGCTLASTDTSNPGDVSGTNPDCTGTLCSDS